MFLQAVQRQDQEASVSAAHETFCSTTEQSSVSGSDEENLMLITRRSSHDQASHSAQTALDQVILMHRHRKVLLTAQLELLIHTAT